MTVGIMADDVVAAVLTAITASASGAELKVQPLVVI